VRTDISLEQVNQHLLHKQHLAQNAKSSSVLEVVKGLLGLHATSSQTPYLSLLARMKRFTRAMLDVELYEKKTLARIRGMRGTLFLVPRESIALVHRATRAEFDVQEYLCNWGLPQREFQELARCITELLEEGSRTIYELKRGVPSMLRSCCIRRLQRRQGRTVYSRSSLAVALTALEAEGRIYSLKDPSRLAALPGAEAGEVNRYALLQKDFPEVDLQAYTVEEARSLLLKRYLAAYGPASLKDMAWWLSLTQKQVQVALRPFAKELVELEIPELGKGFWMLQEDFERLRSPRPSKEPQVALLPYEDMYLKGYKLRGRLIEPEYEKRAYPSGSVRPTVLMDGRIIGIWEILPALQKAGEIKLQISLFEGIDLEIGMKRLILKEAQRVQGFLGFSGEIVMGTN
jgi:hypothetical protein